MLFLKYLGLLIQFLLHAKLDLPFFMKYTLRVGRNAVYLRLFSNVCFVPITLALSHLNATHALPRKVVIFVNGS